MRTQIIVTAFIASLIGIGAAQAQEPRDFSLLATQPVQLPGTTYSRAPQHSSSYRTGVTLGQSPTYSLYPPSLSFSRQKELRRTS
jgi:hypothetical protein